MPSIRPARRKTFFAKLAKYIGRGIKALLERPDGRYCFRLHRDRVYYVSEEQARSPPAHALSPCHKHTSANIVGDDFVLRAMFPTSTSPACLHENILHLLVRVTEKRMWACM